MYCKWTIIPTLEQFALHVRFNLFLLQKDFCPLIALDAASPNESKTDRLWIDPSLLRAKDSPDCRYNLAEARLDRQVKLS